ncbi:unknownprotein [Zostera marina]|uniref:Uncharacterized protein n=1 Tax=Zostera marina TaxID=29655 RepID=A0A0K9Q2T0_ZOSMR|nr:unknownprotein [Zostera marina]
MGNGFRCFMACVLPCGALDLIRVVHINGHVDEYYSNQVSAGEILRANPNHVLTKPLSQGEGVRKVGVVTPDSDLKRGGIYFLVPAEKLLQAKIAKEKKMDLQSVNMISHKDNTTATSTATASSEADALSSKDGCSERKSTHQRRRSSVGEEIWRPNLQKILEDYESQQLKESTN